MQLSDLDLEKSYTYADYLLWELKERVELIKGKIFHIASSVLYLLPFALASCFSAELKEVKGPALGEVAFTFTTPLDSGRHVGTAMPAYTFALDEYMDALPVAWEDAQVFGARLSVISPVTRSLSGFSNVQLYWIDGTDSLNLAYYTEFTPNTDTLIFKPRNLAYPMEKLNGKPLYLSFNSPKLDSALHVEILLQWICTGTLLE